MKKVLLIIDGLNQKKINELLSVTTLMYDKFETYVYSFNELDDNIKGFNYLFKLNQVQKFEILTIAKTLSKLQFDYNFDSIVLEASYTNRMLAPSIAAQLDVGLVADVTNIKRVADEIVMVRPAFDGKIFAGIVSDNKKPIMFSVRMGIFIDDKTDYNMIPSLIEREYNYEKGCTIRLVKQVAKKKTDDIRDAKIIVAGGNGSAKYFSDLSLLATKLDGMVAASRQIIDKNIAPRSIQVGQSGKSVSPQLYIAIGIYGSLQHIEGIVNPKYMIAVNTNKNAPICSLADIVVEGDGQEFIKRISEKLK